ncbi:putative retinol dehydrogenase 12 [Hyaloscypha variabilis F]|uniref:Putative retinol dehydrogenase 12 n=1 Tax=Hyaloscypha variabilis (strain UAMH 11265 / GT02V1 / F) TaxID=1149755 RepID=A0A2J6S7B7_HYAVF|nr:putative retinol dehydrogenase 12 [Hyaloscypha variabilis F]
MSKYNFTTEGSTIVSDFPSRVKDRTFLITGPSDGSIGAATALCLASGYPSTILLLGRSLPKIQLIITQIRTISPTTTTKYIPLNLASLASVRSAASQILSDPSITSIDVLINSAGVMACPYSQTEDGFESQWQTNFLSHFLLTNLLLPKLLLAPHPRIVNISSSAHLVSDILYSDPGFSSGQKYNAILAYAQSKTANILFSVELNRRLGERGVESFAVHPGAVDTGLAKYFTPEMMSEGLELWARMGKQKPVRKTLGQGCSTGLRAALDPGLGVEGGCYLEDCQVTRETTSVAAWALDEKNAERCWKLAEEMLGEKFEY